MDAKTMENNIINGVNENQVVVSLPFTQFNELLRVYREVMARPSPTMNVEKVEEDKSEKNSTTNVEVTTEKQKENDDIISLASDTSIGPKLASTIEIIEKESNQTKPPAPAPAPTNKEIHASKSYGKKLDFDCRLQIRRLSFQDVRKASSSLGDLPKISFKNYMDKQKIKHMNDESNKNRSNEYMDTTRRKSTIEQIRNQRSSSPSQTNTKSASESKRKQSPNRSNERKKTNRREMIESLARNFTAALHNDKTIDSLDDPESIKKWLVSKTINSYEECNQAKK